MIKDLLISSLTSTDVESTYKLFEVSIRDAFEKEGLGNLEEFICEEVQHKKRMINDSLEKPDSDLFFLVAKRGETVVGAISFGPCGEDIKRCTENKLENVGELGSLFILPDYQGQGIGSALISAMARQLNKKGIECFCLDSGYKRAQQRWLRKFGDTYEVAKDYWGPGSDHMIWLCKVSNFI